MNFKFFFLLSGAVAGWELPGAKGFREYGRGDKVWVKVSKVPGAKTHPSDRLFTSLSFSPKVLSDVRCQLKEVRILTEKEKSDLIDAIDKDLHINFMADDLPGALSVAMPLDEAADDTTLAAGEITKEKSEEGSHEVEVRSETAKTLFTNGIPIGAFDPINKKHILINHWNFNFRYKNQTQSELPTRIKIVAFEISPQSMIHVDKHQLNLNVDGFQKKNEGVRFDCDDVSGALILEDLSRNATGHFRIPFTYSVTFSKSKDIWSSQWDSYLKEVSGLGDIHWFSILNTLFIVCILAGVVGIILLKTISRDIARYNKLDDLEESSPEEFGWKLLHGDVFRRPSYSRLLAVCAGSGVQLLGTVLLALLCGGLGLLSRKERFSSVFQILLFLSLGMSWPAGYVSARFTKLFCTNGEMEHEDSPKRHLQMTFATAFIFPGICFATFILLHFISSEENTTSTYLLPIFWFVLSVILVFWGSIIGYRKPTLSIPVRTNQIPRQIPIPKSFHLLFNPIVSYALTGLFPFCAVFSELIFVLGSVWHHKFYYVYGFLILTLLLLIVTCAEISIALTYFTLCAENYHWWWKAFWAPASSGFYIFVYSIFFFYTRLVIAKAENVVVYFVYSALISYALGLLTGAVGFIAAFFFVRSIYDAIKVD